MKVIKSIIISKDDKNFDNNLFFVPINNNFSGYINLNNDSIFY